MTEQTTTSESGETEAYAEETPERPRSKRPRAMWMVASVLGAGAIAASITLGPTFFRILSQKDATLSTPETAAGLTRDNTEDGKENADYFKAALSAYIELDSSTSAMYVDPADSAKSVAFLGGTALLFNPERELDTVINVVTDKKTTVKDWKPVDAGPLGGVMKCGTADGSDVTMTVCGWADHGSIALALFPGRTVEDGARLLRDLRTATQSR